MSDPFLAQITIVGFNFAPRGYALCDGQILPINQYQSLYSLLGTAYGGDGTTTFGLPELRGRTPVHPGRAPGSSLDVKQGQKGGTVTHTITVQQMPAHKHGLNTLKVRAKDAASDTDQAKTNPPANTSEAKYSTETPDADMTLAGALDNTGGGQSHNNMQPYQAVNFCIALQGVFPSRN